MLPSFFFPTIKSSHQPSKLDILILNLTHRHAGIQT
jgi:hypothetical protein